MAAQNTHKRRGLMRIAMLFVVSMIVMLIAFVSMNWKVVSADMVKRTKVNTIFNDTVPVVSSVPTLPPQRIVSSPSFSIPMAMKMYQPNAMKTPQSPVLTGPQTLAPPPQKEAATVLKKPTESKPLPFAPLQDDVAKDGVSKVQNLRSEHDVKKEEDRKEVVEDQKPTVMKGKEDYGAGSERKEVIEPRVPESKEVIEPRVRESKDMAGPRVPMREEAVKESPKIERNIRYAKKKEVVEEEEEDVSHSCDGTDLSKRLEGYSLLSPSDFDCTVRNTGWEEHLPSTTSNTSRAERVWKKRLALLRSFAAAQDQFEYNDDSKYVVFWPIFAGIGNNIAVFTEALLIALLSHRKFLRGVEAWL